MRASDRNIADREVVFGRCDACAALVRRHLNMTCCRVCLMGRAGRERWLLGWFGRVGRKRAAGWGSGLGVGS